MATSGGESNVYVPFSDPSSTTPITTTPQQLLDHKDDLEIYIHNNGQTPSKQKSSNRRSFIRQQWKTFWNMSIPYFHESLHGRCMFFILIILMIFDSGVRVAFSYLARDFWSALGDKDVDEFYKIMKLFLIALLCLAPINVFYRYQRQKLAIEWRQWMTNRILQLYFYDNNHQIYYNLERSSYFSTTNTTTTTGQADNNNSDPNNPSINYWIDNPDQRIAQDVSSFTQYSLSLFLTISVSLIDLAAFSTILYTIEPNLFLSIIGFALVGTIVTILLGAQLVRLNLERLQKEADFRFSLVRIRENAESIAFFHGEHTEGIEINNRFTKVVMNAFDVIGTERNLGFFTASYNYLTWILPVVVIAPQYFVGNVELGVVQQAASAFGHVLDDLSLIINEFEGLSSFSASIGRLHTFLLAIRDLNPDRDDTSPLLGIRNDIKDKAKPPGDGLFKSSSTRRSDSTKDDTKTSPLSASIRTDMAQDNHIQFRQLPPCPENGDISAVSPLALSIRNLRLDTPDCHRTLIHSLNLDLQWGQHLLIIGASGIGKSSLLRAIAGLWKSGFGSIERANTSDTYFLPQKPYCPLGSLRDQLLYPISTHEDNDNARNNINTKQTSDTIYNTSGISDQELLDTLQAVNLGDLASRVGDGNAIAGLNVTMDWSNTLSLGEQQRIAFARILIHKPKLVIVDEATSAMDVSAEERMYKLISNLTVVSVGHRPTLLGYHDVRLHLHKDNDSGFCTATVDPIRSTPKEVNSEEVNLFFR